jgi:adenylate cyclase
MLPNSPNYLYMPRNPGKLTRFWQELKRRKVFGVVTTYAATAYIIIEVTNNLADSLHLPDWIGPIVVLLLVIGLPVVVIISWIFDFTPQGIKKTESVEESENKEFPAKPAKRNLRPSYVLNAVLIIAVIILAYREIFKPDTLERLKSSGGKLSVAVMPFQNMTNDTAWNVYKDVIQTSLISSLSNTREIQVRQQESIKTLFQNQGLSDYASISPSIAGTIARKLDTDIFLYGGLNRAGKAIRLNAQIADTKTNNVIKSFEINGQYDSEKIFDLADSLRKLVTDFLLVSKLIKENPEIGRWPLTTRSPDAFRYFIYGKNAENSAIKSEDWATAKEWCLKALEIDSNYDAPMYVISTAYRFLGKMDSSLYWVNKLNQKKDLWPDLNRLAASSTYAEVYDSYEERIKYFRQMQQIDDQTPSISWLIGNSYIQLRQYKKAIPDLERSIEIYHKWGIDVDWYYRDLGNAYHNTGQYKKEKALYKRAEKYVKEIDQSLIHRRAVLSLSENDTVLAGKHIEKLISSCRDNSISEADINGELGWIYWEAERQDKAEEYFRKALSLEPENPNRMNTLANRLFDRNKNFDEAYKLLDKALELATNKWDYYNYLDSKGMGLYKEGRSKEALEVLQKMYDAAPYKIYFMKSHLEEVKKAISPFYSPE